MLTRTFKKILVGIIGGVVVLAGLLMMPLPGPGVLVVFAGLAILATEFEWCRRLLRRLKAASRRMIQKVRSRIKKDRVESELKSLP